MGWGVTDYPARPEATSQRCTRGCEMTVREKSYECEAKACRNDNLCVGCVFTCFDCEGDFCFDHVLDIAPESADEAIYMCLPCEARRKSNEREKGIAA
jgi:hypothetical protein